MVDAVVVQRHEAERVGRSRVRVRVRARIPMDHPGPWHVQTASGPSTVLQTLQDVAFGDVEIALDARADARLIVWSPESPWVDWVDVSVAGERRPVHAPGPGRPQAVQREQAPPVLAPPAHPGLAPEPTAARPVWRGRLAAAALLGVLGAGAATGVVAQRELDAFDTRLPYVQALPVYVVGRAAPIGHWHDSAPAGASAGQVDHQDRALPVDPSTTAPGGSLRLFYEALVQLEDRSHPWSPIGLHPRALRVVPVTVFDAAVRRGTGVDPGLNLGGASTLSEQVCERVAAHATRAEGGLRRKLSDTFCGMALRWRHRRDPDAIGALYASFVPFETGSEAGAELFVRRHWDLEGVDDPRLTRGMQLVLAAMPKRRWDGDAATWDDGDPQTPDLRGRAHLALDRLVEIGVVPDAERSSIAAEIDAARPRTREEARRVGMSRRLRPPMAFEVPVNEALRVLRARFGPSWREEVSEITLTVDPIVQNEVVGACKEELAALGARVSPGETDARPESAHCRVLMLDANGDVVAAHAADRMANGNFSQLEEERSPGSLGKLLLASSVATTRGAGPGTLPDLRAFEDALRRSEEGIDDTTSIEPVPVRDLIGCYGRFWEETSGAADVVEIAKMGSYASSPVAFAGYLQAAATGRPSPGPRVLSEVALRAGGAAALQPAPLASDAEACARLAYGGGYMPGWLAVPLRPGGTLQHLRGLARGGKTGTVTPAKEDGGGSGRGTNATWVGVVADHPERGMVSGVFFVGAADQRTSIGDGASGSNAAGGVARRVLAGWGR